LLRRSYDSLPSSDFQRRLADLRLAYQLSPMSRADVQWSQQVYDSTTPGVLYYLSTGVRGSVGWRMSELTRFRILGAHEKLQNQAAFNVAGGFPDSIVNRLGASVDYSIARGWRVYAEGSRDRFTTVGGGSAVRDNVLRIGLEYTYENGPGAAERGRLLRRP
jgi:hypothetical protein